MMRVLGCITEDHNLGLIALAASICGVACFTTVTMIGRAQLAAPRLATMWLMSAAAVFGSGVWSLHFVSMLAFMPGMPISYDVRITGWSIGIAILGALFAFMIWKSPHRRTLGTMLGGPLLGLTVSFMHYCGIAAMRLPGTVSYDDPTIITSVGLGIIFATLALLRAETLTSAWRRGEVSLWLAVCVCAVHFTGMSALTITLGASVGDTTGLLGSQALAVTVASVSLVMLLFCLAATLVEEHLSQEYRATEW